MLIPKKRNYGFRRKNPSESNPSYYRSTAISTERKFLVYSKACFVEFHITSNKLVVDCRSLRIDSDVE